MTYPLLPALLVALAYGFLKIGRAWFNRWGATPEELALELPGSDHLRNKRVLNTHAITIHAPASVIWKFLVQLGQNKGGFYSYRRLENLVGCRMPEVKRLLPELQGVALGDKVFLHPKAPPLTVTTLIPERVLALEGWYLVLQSKTPNETRLITRGYDWRAPERKEGVIDFIFSGPLFDFAHFIMERKMLLTIKRLAETHDLLEFAPDARFRGHAEVEIRGSTEEVKEAFRQIRLQDMPLARLLGAIRYLPSRLLRASPIARERENGPFLDLILTSGTVMLHESKSEWITGGAGKYHQILDQEFHRFKSKSEFLAFSDPRYEKLLLCIRFNDLGGGKTRLTLDHWTDALSERARSRFALYWVLIHPLGDFVSWLLLRAVKRAVEDGRFKRMAAPIAS